MSLNDIASLADTGMGQIDFNNSTEVPLNDTVEYTGTWSVATHFSEVSVLVKSDQVATLTIQYSSNGVDVDYENAVTTETTGTLNTISVASKFIRVKLLNGSGVNQTVLRVQTIFHKFKSSTDKIIDKLSVISVLFGNPTLTLSTSTVIESYPLNTTFSYILLSGLDVGGTLSIIDDPDNIFNIVSGNELQLDNVPTAGSHYLTIRYVGDDTVDFVREIIVTADPYVNRRSIQFSGNGYYKVPIVPLNTFGSALSISLWSKNITNASFPISCGTLGGSYAYLIYMKTGGIEFSVYDPSSVRRARETAISYRDNLWHNFVFTWKNNVIKIYADGVDVTGTSTLTFSGTVTALKTTPTEITIGCRGNTVPALFYTGLLDEVGLWNYELEQSDVTEIWNSGFPGDLSVHTNFEYCRLWNRYEVPDSTSLITDHTGVSDATTTLNVTFSGDVPV